MFRTRSPIAATESLPVEWHGLLCQKEEVSTARRNIYKSCTVQKNLSRFQAYESMGKGLEQAYNELLRASSM